MSPPSLPRTRPLFLTLLVATLLAAPAMAQGEAEPAEGGGGSGFSAWASHNPATPRAWEEVKFTVWLQGPVEEVERVTLEVDDGKRVRTVTLKAERWEEAVYRGTHTFQRSGEATYRVLVTTTSGATHAFPEESVARITVGGASGGDAGDGASWSRLVSEGPQRAASFFGQFLAGPGAGAVVLLAGGGALLMACVALFYMKAPFMRTPSAEQLSALATANAAAFPPEASARAAVRDMGYRTPWEASFGGGRNYARTYHLTRVEDLPEVMAEANLGTATVSQGGRAGSLRVTISNCRGAGHPWGSDGCEFERGFLSGAFEVLDGAAADVTETRCGARENRRCEFEVTRKHDASLADGT